jgi:hypothetical protein
LGVSAAIAGRRRISNTAKMLCKTKDVEYVRKDAKMRNVP